MIRARVPNPSGISYRHIAVEAREIKSPFTRYYWKYVLVPAIELDMLPRLDLDIDMNGWYVTLAELQQLPQTDEVKILAMKIALNI